MLQNKNGAVRATFNRNRQEAAMPLATWRCEEGPESSLRGEAWTGRGGREAREAGFRRTGTQNCCTAGCSV